MRRLCHFIPIFVFLFFSGTAAFGDIRIAVIGKTKNDSFYEQAFDGCLKYARDVEGVTCLYDGPADFQDPRSQAFVVKQMLDQNLDGILISTTNSKVLVEGALKEVQKLGIPVITIDSDLLPEHHKYRLAYVGTNNFDFGVALGRYANQIRPEHSSEICIQSGSPTTPNLNERIRGVRFALSGNHENKRLQGENGWFEHERCPFYTLGKRDQAMRQLKFLLSQNEPPVFLAVAGFAQFSPIYIEEILPYRSRILSGDIQVISADAELLQLEALRRGLSSVNIGQRPFEMGRLGAQMLHSFIQTGKKPDKEINYLGFYYCTNKGELACSLQD